MITPQEISKNWVRLWQKLVTVFQISIWILCKLSIFYLLFIELIFIFKRWSKLNWTKYMNLKNDWRRHDGDNLFFPKLSSGGWKRSLVFLYVKFSVFLTDFQSKYSPHTWKIILYILYFQFFTTPSTTASIVKSMVWLNDSWWGGGQAHPLEILFVLYSIYSFSVKTNFVLGNDLIVMIIYRLLQDTCWKLKETVSFLTFQRCQHGAFLRVYIIILFIKTYFVCRQCQSGCSSCPNF